MWFNDKIFDADTTEDQSGSAMEKVSSLTIKVKGISCVSLFVSHFSLNSLKLGMHCQKLQLFAIVLSSKLDKTRSQC